MSAGMRGLIRTLHEWQDFAGAIIGGLLGVAAAIIVARSGFWLSGVIGLMVFSPGLRRPGLILLGVAPVLFALLWIYAERTKDLLQRSPGRIAQPTRSVVDALCALTYLQGRSESVILDGTRRAPIAVAVHDKPIVIH